MRSESVLRLLYRGRLSSCNYDCGYCPFAKRRDSRETLRRDAADLARFVEWAQAAPESLAILFTPWGEGLVRRHYVEALVRLSHAPRVRRVAIQTNLSSNLRWLERADPATLALWCTYHPSQITRERFLARVSRLHDAGIRFSVGMVGRREDLPEIEAMRHALAPSVYLWINAFDPLPRDYYSADEIERLGRIDPHFPVNLAPPPSRGADCRAGDSAFSVDGDGAVRPCHFVQRDLGNLYDGSFRQRRGVQRCPNATCDCYIGYMHRRDLPAMRAFGDGVLERVLALREVPLSA
ncbi:STM4011 family radical SAM protein [Tahibacter amnicola]|uniref:STM4011 family radical SAM protein n=1 Tax=Tahibacter amnicola TaxID=2976241 RepID=A0ABY6BI45_9GAMM|nr:STM4011 family radical SAM protein [Tahibacter amnicola]UXI69459.1 STM4011 family radical SAM protein [Tahibacter amnicola]